MGPQAKGIARVSPATTARALAALARHGVVGVRLDFIGDGLDLLHDRACERLLGRLCDVDFALDDVAECADELEQTAKLLLFDGRGNSFAVEQLSG